ncbi:MAG: hypothetical protein KF773_41715 [Deltaproteobacteria bacterium]|nr:hypothetical protein [Deltaproteobacteria bacterium]MCW5806497.1 hypothetical protein [Deltaproteobacteria bacterium]
MRFCPWYPLAEAGDHAPEEDNVLQLRLAHGLHDYPRGKSAMVLYEHAPDARAAARRLAEAHAGADLLCRHLIEVDDPDLAAFCARLRAEFVRRFGAVPVLESTPR